MRPLSVGDAAHRVGQPATGNTNTLAPLRHDAPAPGFGAIRSGSAANCASKRSSNVVIGMSTSSCRIGVRNPNR